MSTRGFVSAAIALAIAFAGSAQSTAASSSEAELIERSDVKFIPLNPNRGDLSPQSGRLWGNIREDETSGMLVTFADGFQSPPHIHNITYRAVVIEGAVHNDDPAAEKMWMGPGSFWTQPLGETHITAAKGEAVTIFLEILSGPYLVKPAADAFDAGERPINVDAGNVVWLNAADTTWIAGSGPELAYLWGTTTGNEKNGTFLKLPAGYSGTLSTAAPLMRVVTIQGATRVHGAEGSNAHDLGPGSYFGSRGEASHRLACVSDEACVLYLHTEGTYRLTPR